MPSEMLICGRVITGKGEGRFYIAREEYSRQFQKAFGFVPFSGTLNLLLMGRDYKKFQMLREKEGIKIVGFEKDGKRFGEVKCFNCILNKMVRGIIIIPEKSEYRNIMEVVSDKNLRDELSLTDEDLVDVSVGQFRAETQ